MISSPNPGAVGGPKWGVGKIRPEQGLLAIRKELDLYANVRPALFPSESLLAHSPLKPEVAKGTSFIVIRELVKGLYYGDRKEADLETPGSDGEAYDMMVYNKFDVQRITRLAAALALKENPPAKIHSIDKANVLATSRLWRKVVQDTVDQEFKSQGVEVDHQLVDSAAMVMVSNPRKLNGIVLSESILRRQRERSFSLIVLKGRVVAELSLLASFFLTCSHILAENVSHFEGDHKSTSFLILPANCSFALASSFFAYFHFNLEFSLTLPISLSSFM